MKYAVVKIAGSQYKVSEGDELKVNQLPREKGEKINLDEILLVSQDGRVEIGTPLVKDAKVSAQVVEQFLGEKLHIYKFKAKTGYRRKMGFRPHQTLLKIEKITV